MILNVATLKTYLPQNSVHLSSLGNCSPGPLQTAPDFITTLSDPLNGLSIGEKLCMFTCFCR